MRKTSLFKLLITIVIIIWVIAITIAYTNNGCGIIKGILFPITIGSGLIYIIYNIKKK